MLYAASARGHGLRELELELVLLARAVHAEPEHARDRLRSQPRPRPELGGDGGKANGLGGRAEPGERDEACVELANRHGRIGIGDGDRTAEARDHGRELARGQRIVRA